MRIVTRKFEGCNNPTLAMLGVSALLLTTGALLVSSATCDEYSNDMVKSAELSGKIVKAVHNGEKRFVKEARDESLVLNNEKDISSVAQEWFSAREDKYGNKAAKSFMLQYMRFKAILMYCARKGYAFKLRDEENMSPFKSPVEIYHRILKWHVDELIKYADGTAMLQCGKDVEPDRQDIMANRAEDLMRLNCALEVELFESGESQKSAAEAFNQAKDVPFLSDLSLSDENGFVINTESEFTYEFIWNVDFLWEKSTELYTKAFESITNLKLKGIAKKSKLSKLDRIMGVVLGQYTQFKNMEAEFKSQALIGC